MTIKRDEKLYRIYGELAGTLPCSRDDAELLFWVQTYRLLDQSRMVDAAKSDAMGILMHRINGFNNCGTLLRFCREQQDEYRRFEEEFRISTSLNDLGERWKRNLSAIEHMRDFPLRIWLESYAEVCMPAIDRIIAEAELEFGISNAGRLTEADVALRRKQYRAYRAQLKQLMEKLDAVEEFLTLREIR